MTKREWVAQAVDEVVGVICDLCGKHTKMPYFTFAGRVRRTVRHEGVIWICECGGTPADVRIYLLDEQGRQVYRQEQERPARP